ncbi:hypothetical protein [Streptomyces sp. NPDC002889]|uniref:hypothetical protein n=1 Tax=Streptomyces sp. NPDC002889 TaxID=3364669 RepID=UPI0036ACEEB7
MAAALLLLTAVGCDRQTDAKAPGPSATAGRAGAARSLTAEEARRVVTDVNERTDTDSQDAAFWREVAEGPWLEQRLATVETAKKYGTKAPPDPTNSPKTSPKVHAWSAAGPEGRGRWILGAYEIAGRTVGEEKKSARLQWSFYHQQGGAWRRTFLVEAPSRSALPELATGSDGQAATGGDVSELVMPPSTACARYGDYVTGKDGAAADGTLWSKEIDTGRGSFATVEQDLRESTNNPASIRVSVEPRRAPHGPVWRTADGGALVACVAVSSVAVDTGPGRYSQFTSSGWKGTTGIRWAAYTQSQLSLTVLKIPAGSGEVSDAAGASWPYHFNGTRYTGS